MSEAQETAQTCARDLCGVIETTILQLNDAEVEIEKLKDPRGAPVVAVKHLKELVDVQVELLGIFEQHYRRDIDNPGFDARIHAYSTYQIPAEEAPNEASAPSTAD